MLDYIRGHWRTENSCHWVLDAIYREDHNKTRDRNAAANQSVMRRMALNAHNLTPFEGKKRKSLPKRELRAASQPDSGWPRQQRDFQQQQRLRYQ